MRFTSRRLAESAGWIGVAFGTAHVVIAPTGTPVPWSQVLSEGWWNTFTLTTSTTLADFQRAETFWITIGSFGAPMLVLGSYVVWAARRGVRVPGWVGWMLLAWGLTVTTALPASPGWAIPVIGALLVLADRQQLRVDRPSSLALRVPAPSEVR